jgi:hypothetical protein
MVMRVASHLKRGVAVLVMLGALAACNPTAQNPNTQNPNGPSGPSQPGPFANNTGPNNPNPGANGWPPMQPTPGQPQQPGWPGNPQQPGQPGYSSQPSQYPQPGYPNQPAGPIQVSAPQGMQPLQSPAGAVFQTTLNGSRSASQLSQAVVQALQQGYFDRPPQIMGAMNDPSDMFGQVGFQTTLQGRPVMGMIAVMSNGQNGGRAYLLFDSAERFNQTAPVMMNVVQQHAGMGGGGGYPGQY